MNEAIDAQYNITANKEGCYKQVAGAELVYQSDMSNVTLDTCKKRASDLAYAGFSMKPTAEGQLGCYLTNDVTGNKAAGISTKSQTSMAFKTDKNANMGGLLMNGQLGLFNGSTFDILTTDLTAVPGCNADGSKITINPNTVTATWGGNCVNTIKSELNGKCIDQNNGSKDPYLQMQMLDCVQGNPNQNMVYNNDTQNINVPGDNLCMDVLGAGTADGTKVIQYSCNGGTNQKWTYGMDKTLQPQNAPGKCLDYSTNENGAGLIIYSCHDALSQKWDITRNGAVVAPIPPPSFLDTSKQYHIESINTNNCVFNNSDGRFGTYQCSAYNDQYWIPFAVPGQQNTYMFKGVNSYYSLYADTNGEFSTAVSDINNPAQQWQLLPVSGQPDTYQLTNKKTNSCMINNVDGRFNMAGCVAAYNDQWWKITPISP